MTNLVVTIVSIIVLVTGGIAGTPDAHVAFPFVADDGGQAVYLYRVAAGHNSNDGDLCIVDASGAELYRVHREAFGANADLRPGGIAHVGGLWYVSFYVADWTKPTPAFPMTSRARVFVADSLSGPWLSLWIPNYGISQHTHGNPFIQDGSLFVPTYAIDSTYRWLSILWRYDLTAHTWHLRSKWVADGVRHTELSIARISDNEWLAGIRMMSTVDLGLYFWRSTNNGVSWTKETQTLPINAHGMTYHDSIVYIAGRGCGGSCLYASSDGGRTFARTTLDVFYMNCGGDGGMADVGVVGGVVIATWYGTAPDCRLFIKAAEVGR